MDEEFLEIIAEKFDSIISELATIRGTSLDLISIAPSTISNALEKHNKLLKQQNELLAKLVAK